MTAPALRAELPSSNITDALWRLYRQTGDQQARAQLLELYLGLVHQVVRSFRTGLNHADREGLVGAGTLGLIRAVEGYDPARGVLFSTYAIHRIRGAILDELRSRDWTPRSVRAKRRHLAAAASAVEAEQGRAAEPREVADALRIDLQTYWAWRSTAEGGVTVPLDGGARPDAQGGPIDYEALLASDQATPGDELCRRERADLLRHALATLPDREQTVLALYFYEDLTLRQIAEVLGVTESRVSQIRTRAMRRLRDQLNGTDVALTP